MLICIEKVCCLLAVINSFVYLGIKTQHMLYTPPLSFRGEDGGLE